MPCELERTVIAFASIGGSRSSPCPRHTPGGGALVRHSAAPRRGCGGRPPQAWGDRVGRAALPQLDDLGERDLQPPLELEQDAEGRIDLAAFDRADVIAVQAGAVAELLLRE